MRQLPPSFQYENDFAVVNKSYAKDLRWSVVMYRSWRRFADPVTPFFMVVPSADLPAFDEAFRREVYSSRIDAGPRLLAEEDLFEKARIFVPPHFGGWHRQQIVKLCFAKSRLAKNYMTIDSSIIFTKKFDYRSLLNGTRICTSAMPVNKVDFFGGLKKAEQKGWLDGRLSGIEECFERICFVMDNDSEATNAYVSCTGLFDSDIACDLEVFARSKGLDGYVGILSVAPYEFAWYGEFVFIQHPHLFKAFGPHLMTLAESDRDANNVARGTIIVPTHHFGVMFQPPAAELCVPDQAYAMLVRQ